jgi:hypothetical protein
LPPADALSLVSEATERIWRPEGADALAYMHGRGLNDETIKAARLGWTPRVMVPTRDGDRCYQARGVVIPWFDGDRLVLVKIRRLDAGRPKYGEAFRDRPSVFPGPAAVRPGLPLIIVEGEFDALLVQQEVGAMASVVTMGSASNRTDPDVLARMLSAPAWFIATDADKAGDAAASKFPARARRVRPPGSYKDWTEAHQHRVNLRRWWSDRLRGIETPQLFTWDELSRWRWGPAEPRPIEAPERN